MAGLHQRQFTREPQGLKIGTICILAGTVAFALVLLLLPPHRAAALTIEGGLVENLSAVVLGIGALSAGLSLWRCRSLVWSAVTLVFVWMYLRELDYQTLFTPRSIESVGFYTNPRVPLGMKLAAVAALAPFGLAGLFLLLTGIKATRRAPSLVHRWGAIAGAAATLFTVAYLSEKLHPPRFQVLEEIAELGFAALLTFVVVHSQFARRAVGPV